MSAVLQMRERQFIASSNEMRNAQVEWASRSIHMRLSLLSKLRHLLAAKSGELADAFSLHLSRNRADSLIAEVLPLLAACKFLEVGAAKILRTRRLGRRGLPIWLAGLNTIVERVPYGIVLIVAPANYPLFLPGVQALQALAAGNAVIWKPGTEGQAVATLFAQAMHEAGFPRGLLRVTEDSLAASTSELQAQPDKIFLTGSSLAGREVLRVAAETVTPVVAELSGCDAVMVLPTANLELVADALTFGMRLNGSATCMAPRRLFLFDKSSDMLLETLERRFASVEGVHLEDSTRRHLITHLEDARRMGATIVGDPLATPMRPLLVLNGTPIMSIAKADLFAPVLTILRVENEDELVTANSECPFALTVAIFGDLSSARRLGERLCVGTVLINDLIVPTADPRVSFGGRRRSGFGSTRGVEGLLEMTVAKTTSIRTSRSRRHFAATAEAHENFFEAIIMATHGGTLRARLNAVRRFIGAAKSIK